MSVRLHSYFNLRVHGHTVTVLLLLWGFKRANRSFTFIVQAMGLGIPSSFASFRIVV
jgi:hypothetical protein